MARRQARAATSSRASLRRSTVAVPRRVTVGDQIEAGRALADLVTRDGSRAEVQVEADRAGPCDDPPNRADRRRSLLPSSASRLLPFKGREAPEPRSGSARDDLPSAPSPGASRLVTGRRNRHRSGPTSALLADRGASVASASPTRPPRTQLAELARTGRPRRHRPRRRPHSGRACTGLVERCLAKRGRIDILVNNAASWAHAARGELLDFDDKQLHLIRGRQPQGHLPMQPRRRPSHARLGPRGVSSTSPPSARSPRRTRRVPTSRPRRVSPGSPAAWPSTRALQHPCRRGRTGRHRSRERRRAARRESCTTRFPANGGRAARCCRAAARPGTSHAPSPFSLRTRQATSPARRSSSTGAGSRTVARPAIRDPIRRPKRARRRGGLRRLSRREAQTLAALRLSASSSALARQQDALTPARASWP